MKKLLLVGLFLVGAYFTWLETNPPGFGVAPVSQSADRSSGAFVEPRSGGQTQGSGVVKNILRDDNEGSRHQRFIVEVDNGRTLLVAHNIDLAPRIASLKVGDIVQFFGEYESNAKGGVIHWTHRDPNGRHVDGWLKHEGRIYQ